MVIAPPRTGDGTITAMILLVDDQRHVSDLDRFP
jgi:hypothetical protein